MVKNENFKENLSEIKKILTEKKQISTLAERSGVSVRTVYDTFESESFSELSGKKLTVYRTAIQMIEEISALPAMAENALNKHV